MWMGCAAWLFANVAMAQDADVRAAYNAAEYLAPRRAMLEWWNDLIDAKAQLGELIG